MNEDFLHFIFKNKLWTDETLYLTSGEAFEIIDTGMHNKDSGPDFFNAKIKIDDKIWVGNIEIHIKSSDWFKHSHHKDMAYNNVILHVVYENDKSVIIAKGEEIPTWEITFPHILFNKYAELKTLDNPIPCSSYLDITDEINKKLWLERMAIERLEHKSEYIGELMQKNANSFEDVLYISLARSFGFGTNSDAFEQLAKSLNLNIIRKYSDSIFKTEALLFGQSGLFDNIVLDDYANSLISEYNFLAKKHNLKPLKQSIWKFSKMRPMNFPHVRIAQFAEVMTNFQGLFANIIASKNLSETEKYFKIVPSDYWKTHYVFGKPIQKANTGFGKSSYNTIAINTLAPLAFYYYKNYSHDNKTEDATDWLTRLKAEDNRIIRLWSELGIVAKNAFETQALINLKKNYCDLKKCLQCSIGVNILKEINKI